MQISLDHHKNALIFSDLDGTLLDHHDYSFDAAQAMLNALKTNQVPVVLNTSKTAAEVKHLQRRLSLTHPFIVENGAAVYIPQHTFAHQPNDTQVLDEFWVKHFADDRNHWLDVIAKLKPQFKDKFEGFAEMSSERIAEVTGLTQDEAKEAAQREFGEPLLWLGSDAQRDMFIEAASQLGAHPILGGRFLHICGNSNKGTAMTWLRDEYAQQWDNTELKTIALGDGNNDIAMLEDADVAVRILSPVNPPPRLQRTEGVITTRLMGPGGWQEALISILPSLGKFI